MRIADASSTDVGIQVPTRGALPNLIIIGAAKCGTTSLHNYLDLHPQISMSRRKEVNFFLEDRNWGRGIDWYADHFDPSAAVRGESSTAYTDLPRSAGTADRMHSIIPDARLIYLVRDPLERMASAYVHRRVGGREHRPFAEALSDPESVYVSRSSFATQLRPFLELFPRAQVLVETHERLLRDRQATLDRIFEFVGIDRFESPEFDLQWEQTKGKGSALSLSMRIGRWTRKRGVRLPRFMRWPAQQLLRGLPDRKVERPAYDEGLRELMRERLRGEVEDLRRLTGLTLEDWSI